jgi:hypothetical protein
MKRQVAVLAVGLTLCAAVLAGDDATKPGKAAVKGVSLSVNQKLDKGNFPFAGNSSITLNLLVSTPGKKLLAVDPSSKVSEFRDDRDTDLIKVNQFGKPTFSLSSFAKDHSAALVSVSSFGAAPARGASKLLLKGSLVLHTGSDEKTTEEKEVELKEKTEAKLGGDLTLRVTREKGFAGGGPSFVILAPNPAIKSVTLKDAEGKDVGNTPGFGFGFGTYYNSFEKAWTTSFSLPKPATKIKVTVGYYSKTNRMTVPVDLALGIGL